MIKRHRYYEATSTANYIRNRCPSKSLFGETPFKLWTGRNPVVAYFQKFGSTAYMLDKTKSKGKFESKSMKCIFIGYSTEAKAYRLWNPYTRKIVRSRDVSFSNTYQSKVFVEFIGEEFFENTHEPNIEVKAEVIRNSPEKAEKKIVESKWVLRTK